MKVAAEREGEGEGVLTREGRGREWDLCKENVDTWSVISGRNDDVVLLVRLKRLQY